MHDQKEWTDLSPKEKQTKRFERWLSPEHIKFNDSAAEDAYKKRVNRFISAITLKEADRVPLILPAGTVPIYDYGINLKEAMYDNEKLCEAYRVFLKKFEADTYCSPMMVSPGRAPEIIDTLTIKWPGRGLPDDATMHQFVEGEYMKADEYDIFLNDVSDFCFRYYFPRTMGALQPFANFAPISYSLGMPSAFLMPAVMPEVQQAFQAIIDFGKETAKWNMPLMEFEREAFSAGFPSFYGGISHAPFDILADTLRGTHGIMMDMYRQPENIHKAMKKIIPIVVDNAVQMANRSGNPMILMPLHKGDDAFMSEKQYLEFYWPDFREVLIQLTSEGLVPLLFAEGKYTKRLKIIKDLPEASVLWWFDQTDMKKAKEVLGGVSCIMGNVPTSLLCTGTPQDVKEYSRELIEVCGKGGGFILNGGASMDKGNPENLRAMIDAVNEYGVYQTVASAAGK
ncbi:MAG: hypothetical protein JW864_11590 [Spirochaetes bacterium]|nr:hypothetical protein [Spirochaetota bacterium]